MRRLNVAGVPQAETIGGARLSSPSATSAGVPANARIAVSYLPAPGENVLCHGKTKAGQPCKNHAIDGDIYCAPHVKIYHPEMNKEAGVL